MSRPRLVVAVIALGLVAVAAVAWLGPLTRERTPIASTGAPAPVNQITPISLAPGRLLCATDIALGPRMQEAELILTGEGPAPPLVVRAQTRGFTSPPATIPETGPGLHAVRVAIEPPPANAIGRVCVRNAGRTAANFVATTELRTYTKLRTFVDGEPHSADLALKFYERRQVSALGDLPGIVDRMAIGRGFLGAAWLVWLLLAVLAVGVPLLVLRALAGALSTPRLDRSAADGLGRRDDHR